MEEKFNPWEFVSSCDDGIYILKLADEETRQKQLEEFKNKREKELLKELRELEMLH